MNFLAVDVETANADFASICAVGFVYFKDGAVSKRLGLLINPEDEFDPVNIGIHGIEAAHVASAPTMAQIFPAINNALNTTVVVHHTHFDKVALCRAAERYGFSSPACKWLDSARVARRAWKQYSKRGYGLRNLATEFGIEFEHHNAVEDAYAAGEILLRALRETNLSIEEWLLQLDSRSSGSRYAKRIMRSGNAEGPLAGEVLVFTGSLSIPRAEAADLAAETGCEVAGGVTKETTILVVGDDDVRSKNGKSTKYLKAEKLIMEGQPIKILRESDFRQLVFY